MNIPVVETERLVLRAFCPADRDSLAKILTKKEVVQYIGTGGPVPEEKIPLIIEKSLQTWEKYGYGRWAVTLKESGELIGWSGMEFLPDSGESEVLYLYDQPYWGKGYASEAAFASIRYWYEQTDVEEIIGLTYPENVPSQIILKKIGLKYFGEGEYFGLNLLVFKLKKEGYIPSGQDYNISH